MFNPNPDLYVHSDISSEYGILTAIYEHQVASVALAFSLFGFYWFARFLFWFLPKFWYRRGDK